MKKPTTVRFSLDLNNLPPLTALQQEELAKLAAMPDSEIDYSDIPRSTGQEIWTRPGVLGTIENKQQVTLRLDADVLQFFKGTGRRYQTRINAALREYVTTHKKSA